MYTHIYLHIHTYNVGIYIYTCIFLFTTPYKHIYICSGIPIEICMDSANTNFSMSDIFPHLRCAYALARWDFINSQEKYSNLAAGAMSIVTKGMARTGPCGNTRRKGRRGETIPTPRPP